MGQTGALQTEQLPVIYYDGCCNLCSGLVRFLVKHGGHRKFRFVPQQAAGDQFSRQPDGSVVLLFRNRPYFKSDAVLRACIIMGFPWHLAAIGWLIPRFFRDRIYNFVARNRVRWFGTPAECAVKDDAGH